MLVWWLRELNLEGLRPRNVSFGTVENATSRRRSLKPRERCPRVRVKRVARPKRAQLAARKTLAADPATQPLRPSPARRVGPGGAGGVRGTLRRN